MLSMPLYIISTLQINERVSSLFNSVSTIMLKAAPVNATGASNLEGNGRVRG